jgi:hypothetical protein
MGSVFCVAYGCWILGSGFLVWIDVVLPCELFYLVWVGIPCCCWVVLPCLSVSSYEFICDCTSYWYSPGPCAVLLFALWCFVTCYLCRILFMLVDGLL